LSYVTEAWFSLEGSPEPGGLPAVFLLKTLIPVMALLLGLQAIAEIIRSIQQLLVPVQPADHKTGKDHG
jgi:TRAP-type mannitol/chloroaromatic compound transport system permease small subunit